jgi:hypothetical protein
VPASAHAATVRVQRSPEGRYPGYSLYDPHLEEVDYVAAPGELNRLVVSYPDDAESVTVTDPGAVIHPGESCTSIDAHTARCVASPSASTSFLQHAQADLGDGDDTLRTTHPAAYPVGGVTAFGGPGDDRLDGGSGGDELDGGEGRDTLLGGADGDVLTDSDGAQPGRDVMDGGSGHDLVSYQQRTRPVAVYLDGSRPAGERGERDVVRNVEDATGGEGPDRLSGDGNANTLSGLGGADVLIGRGGGTGGIGDGRDVLTGGAGRDWLAGGDGTNDLHGGRGLDSFACEPGSDTVFDPEAGELIRRSCEAIEYNAVYPFSEGALILSPYPVARSSTAVEFRIGCPEFDEDDGEPQACSANAALRDKSGHLIGKGRLSNKAESTDPRTRIRLNRRGRRLANRRRGVIATVSLRGGPRFPGLAWTIRLKV